MSNVQEYKKKYQAKLDEWEAEITKLKAKARQEKSDNAIKLQHQIEELEGKHELLKDKLNTLSESGENALSELKSGIEKAGSDLSGSIKAATHKFS